MPYNTTRIEYQRYIFTSITRVDSFEAEGDGGEGEDGAGGLQGERDGLALGGAPEHARGLVEQRARRGVRRRPLRLLLQQQRQLQRLLPLRQHLARDRLLQREIRQSSLLSLTRN